MNARADVAVDTIPRLRFDAAIIVFHWTTVLLVLAQFATGFGTAYMVDESALARLLFVHRSLGACVFALTLVRLMWRRGFARLPPFPPHMPMLQQRAATANEYALYGLLLMQPLTGLGDTLFRARPFPLFIWTIPPLLPRTPVLYKALHAAHEWGAEALLALVGLHAAAALFHHFVLRDRVLQRILPGK